MGAHAAIAICSKGEDGRTPYERMRGRRCNIPVAPFGEFVIYKEIREGKARKNKLDTEDKDGIYLGHARNANEVLIGTPEGVVRAYSFRRRAEGRRWNQQAIQEMRGTPRQPDPGRPGLKIPVRVANPVGPGQGPREEENPRRPGDMEVARRMKITKKMLQAYGHTEGCLGCIYSRAALTKKRDHTEQCRTRIYQAIQQDESNQGKQMQEKMRREQVRKENEGARTNTEEAEKETDGDRTKDRQERIVEESPVEGTDGEQEIQGKQDEKGDDGMEESAADDEKKREADDEEQKDVEMGNLVKERIAFIEAEEKRITRGERGKWD